MFSGALAKRPQATGKDARNVEVGESLSALERGRHFGTSKLSLQRLVFVNELVDCAHEIGYEATIVHLLPLVRHLASDPEVLVRQSLVGHFGDLAGFLIQSDPELGYQKVVDELLPIVSLLLSEKADEVRQGAAEALTTLASHLRPGERGDQVLMTAIALAHSNDDEDARSTAVHLLNGLAETLGSDLCRCFVGVEIEALCEDPNFRVRKATAASFAEVARMVGDDYVLRRLLPAYSKLVHDAHWGVRKAAAEGLIGIIMALAPEKREAPVVPLMNALLKDSSRWVRMSALQQIGFVIAALESVERVPASLLSQYVDIIEQTTANPDAADISYHCGYTFAAVVKAMGRDSWSTLKFPFVSLCRGTQLKTRKAMAASIHVVAQSLGAELTEAEVFPQFEILVQDSQTEVRLAALRNVAPLLRCIASTAARRRLLKALQATLAAKATGWRLRHLVASQLGAICEALGSSCSTICNGGNADASPSPGRSGGDDEERKVEDLVWSIVIPLFLQLNIDSVAEVRDEAARAAARVIRTAAPELLSAATPCEGSSGCLMREPLPLAAVKLSRHLTKVFARGRSFRNRMTYIRMCDSIVRESPPDVFTEAFLKPLVRLSRDRVKNVRLCWVTTMIPHFRKAGRLGNNHLLVGAALRMAASDTDPEVIRVLKGVTLAVLPEALNGELPPESDLDESDKGETWQAEGGGTGESSECSDVGVADDKEDDAKQAVTEVSPSSQPSNSPSQAEASAPIAELSLRWLNRPPPDVSRRDGYGFEKAAAGGEAAQAPAGRGASASDCHTQQRRNSPKAGPQALVHDAVEDSLCEQGEMDRVLNATFADRRLLAEELEALRLEGDAMSPLAPKDALCFPEDAVQASTFAAASTTSPVAGAQAQVAVDAAARVPAAAPLPSSTEAAAPSQALAAATLVALATPLVQPPLITPTEAESPPQVPKASLEAATPPQSPEAETEVAEPPAVAVVVVAAAPPLAPETEEGFVTSAPAEVEATSTS